MKSIKRIFFLLSFISVSYLSTFAQENQSYFLHTIEKGQSLYSISSMYGVSKADIIRLNPGCEDKIYAGQAIKIPQNKTAQKGETFHTIDHTKVMQDIQYNCPKNRRKTCFRTRDVLSL